MVEYVQAHDQDWAVIMFEGKQAYVSSKYLAAEEAPQQSNAETEATTAAQ